MAEHFPPRISSPEAADSALRHFREYVAAAIALVVIVGNAAMMVVALGHIDSTEAYPRVKDLLLLVNPLLGVVVGYYFSKVTTEARAEKAELAADQASISAQTAMEARGLAEIEAKTARLEAQQAKAALMEVGQAGERLLAHVSAEEAGLRGEGEEGEETRADPRREFEAAWAYAKRTVVRPL